MVGTRYPAGGGGLTVGTTTITGGTDKRVLFDDNGVVGESAGLTFTKGNGGTTSLLTLGAGPTLGKDGNGGLAIYAISTAAQEYYISGNVGYGYAYRIRNDGGYAWSPTTSGAGGVDTAFSRVSAGVVALDTGTRNNAIGQLNLGVLKHTGVAFASLPASPLVGMVQYISDSSTATWGATIAGGGANKVLAWYNNANWTVIGA